MAECSLDTWLMRIAVNLVRDHVRNRRLRFWKRMSRNSEESGTADIRIAAAGVGLPEAQMLLREQVGSVWRAAARGCRSVSARFSCCASSKIWTCWRSLLAAGMKEGTVKAHLFSAVRKVRQQMGVTV